MHWMNNCQTFLCQPLHSFCTCWKLILWLTIAGEDEWLSDVLTDDSDLYADLEYLLQLLLCHTWAPHKACVLRAVYAWISRAQPTHKNNNNALRTAITLALNDDAYCAVSEDPFKITGRNVGTYWIHKLKQGKLGKLNYKCTADSKLGLFDNLLLIILLLIFTSIFLYFFWFHCLQVHRKIWFLLLRKAYFIIPIESFHFVKKNNLISKNKKKLIWY